nr:hypothetical protein [Actinoplanes auranticolor]
MQLRRYVHHAQACAGVPAGTVGVEQRTGHRRRGVPDMAEIHDQHRRTVGDREIDQRVTHVGDALGVEAAPHRSDQVSRPDPVCPDPHPCGVRQGLPRRGRRLISQAVTQFGDGTAQQPRDAHLGGAQLAGDLRLGAVAEEVALDDLAFPARQPVDDRPYGQAVAHRLQGAVLVSEQVLPFGGVVVPADRPVQ